MYAAKDHISERQHSINVTSDDDIDDMTTLMTKQGQPIVLKGSFDLRIEAI